MKRNAQLSLNILIFLLIAGFVWYMASSMNKEEKSAVETTVEEGAPFASPYTKASAFELPEKIICFELYGDRLYIVSGRHMYVYNVAGEQLSRFPVASDVRDITLDKESVYVLYPTRIEVYSLEGGLVHQWEACSELSDYCSLTAVSGYVFVTDVANKNICQYTEEGNFVRFIQSPREFLIPSYSFDIDHRNDTVYCVNAGRHLIETYTLDGRFIAAFGGPGGKEGFFAGCCNPSYITFMPDGKLLTSEKGNPRISTYGHDGRFDRMLLNGRGLGGGTDAYGVKASGDTLFVSGEQTLSAFRYQPAASNSSL